MQRFATSVLLLVASQAVAAEPRLVPLEDIWAYGFTNTQSLTERHRNLREIDSVDPKSKLTPELRRRSSFWRVHDALGILQGDKFPEGAFLVDGTGKEALQAAGDFFADGVEPKLTSGTEKSAILFAHHSGGYTPVIEYVQVHEGLIRVAYRYELRTSKDLKRYIAVVPIGDFPWPEGRIAVNCLSVVFPDGRPAPVHHRINQIMCQPADFLIPD